MQKIDIKLKPSKIFIYLTVLTIMACLAIIVTLPAEKWIKTLLLIVTMRYGWYVLKTFGFLTARNSISQISAGETGWKLHIKSKIMSVELCGESTLTYLLCVLRFKLPETNKKLTCLVFKDAVMGDDYRRLLVRLRTSSLEKKIESV